MWSKLSFFFLVTAAGPCFPLAVRMEHIFDHRSITTLDTSSKRINFYHWAITVLCSSHPLLVAKDTDKSLLSEKGSEIANFWIYGYGGRGVRRDERVTVIVRQLNRVNSVYKFV
jgi:hypothetical protein